MKKRRKPSKKLIALVTVIIAAAAISSSTYLWFSESTSTKNIFNMDTFDVHFTEEFNPDDPVVPGAKINKKVGITNNSQGNVIVRVRLKETLQLIKPDASDPTKLGVLFRSSPDVGSNEVIVTTSKAYIDGLSSSGYQEMTLSPAPPAGVHVLKRDQQSPDGTGVKTEYFAYYLRNSVYQLMGFDPAETGDARLTYAFYEKDDPINVIHGTGGDSIDHSLFNLTVDLVDGSHSDPRYHQSMWSLHASSGWYVYTKVLKPGETSKNITESVEFSASIGNLYKGALYILEPEMEAIQALQTAADAQWDANKPPRVAISGEDVTIVP